MNPKQFLQIGGIVLVLVAILGFVGVIGPTAERSIFGSPWYFDNGENWAHLIIGVVALSCTLFKFEENMLKWLVILVGILALLVGIIGFFLSPDAPNFIGANLENPADNILHIAIGAWALWAGMRKGAGQVTA